MGAHLMEAQIVSAESEKCEALSYGCDRCKSRRTLPSHACVGCKGSIFGTELLPDQYARKRDHAMNRRILAALIATIAAHSMVLFLWTLGDLPIEKWTFPELVGAPIAALIVGTVGACLYGIPLFLIAYLLGTWAHYGNRENRWIAIVAGGMTGLCYPVLLFNVLGFGGPNLELRNPLEVLPYFLSGCFSGYLYWRIAIAHQKSEAAL